MLHFHGNPTSPPQELRCKLGWKEFPRNFDFLVKRILKSEHFFSIFLVPYFGWCPKRPLHVSLEDGLTSQLDQVSPSTHLTCCICAGAWGGRGRGGGRAAGWRSPRPRSELSGTFEDLGQVMSWMNQWCHLTEHLLCARHVLGQWIHHFQTSQQSSNVAMPPPPPPISQVRKLTLREINLIT